MLLPERQSSFAQLLLEYLQCLTASYGPEPLSWRLEYQQHRCAPKGNLNVPSICYSPTKPLSLIDAACINNNINGARCNLVALRGHSQRVVKARTAGIINKKPWTLNFPRRCSAEVEQGQGRFAKFLALSSRNNGGDGQDSPPAFVQVFTSPLSLSVQSPPPYYSGFDLRQRACASAPAIRPPGLSTPKCLSRLISQTPGAKH